MAGLVFLSAGRLDYWQGWLFFGINLAVVALSAWLLKDDRGLIAERLHPGKGMKWWDKGYYLLSTPLCFAAVVVARVGAGRGHRGSPPPGVTPRLFSARV